MANIEAETCSWYCWYFMYHLLLIQLCSDWLIHTLWFFHSHPSLFHI